MLAQFQGYSGAQGLRLEPAQYGAAGVGFGLEVPGHQFGYDGVEILALVKNAVDGFGQGHADVVALGQLVR